jgi:hypothetical protein
MRFERMLLAGTGLTLLFLYGIYSCGGRDTPSHHGHGGGFTEHEHVDPRGDGDQSNHLEQGSSSPVVGTADRVVTRPGTLRLQFLHLRGEPAGTGTDFQFLPGTTDMLVTLREGKLAKLHLEDQQAEVRGVWPLKEQMLIQEACGPTNLLLDQKFEKNRFLYVTYCKSETINQLVRYEFDDTTGPVRPRVIFETIVPAGELWRRFGSIGWEDDDVMWMLVGDHAQPAEGQNPESPLGSIIRLVPNRDPGGQGFSLAPRATSLVFAYGFRAPWRGTRDTEGRFWVGDVGDEDLEEVNLVTGPGQNFGWDLYSGPCNDGCSQTVSPLLFYDRSNEHEFIQAEPGAHGDASRAVWVGQIYQNPSVDRYAGLMTDVVAFGDVFTGFIRGLRVNSKGVLTENKPIGALAYVAQWRPGPDGYIYVLDLGGQLHVALLVQL